MLSGKSLSKEQVPQNGAALRSTQGVAERAADQLQLAFLSKADIQRSQHVGNHVLWQCKRFVYNWLH